MRKVDGQGTHVSVVDDAGLAGLMVVIDRPDGTQDTRQVGDRVEVNDVVSQTYYDSDNKLQFLGD